LLKLLCAIPCIYVQSLEDHVEKRRVQLEELEKWWSAGEGEEESDLDVSLLSATLELQANEMYVPSIAMILLL
jgi:hypothetical protein